MASVTSFNVLLVVMMACCVSTFAQTTGAPPTIADQTNPDQTTQAAPDSPATPAAPAPGDSSESSEESAPAAPGASASGAFSSKSSEEKAPAAPAPGQAAEPGAPPAAQGAGAPQAAGAPANGGRIGSPASELVVGGDLSKDDASGNQLPRKSSHLHSGRGSSASNAGIAVASIALIGLVMGSIIFVIKKYRNNSPVFSEL